VNVYNVLQCAAVRCDMLLCVAVTGSVQQCVTVAVYGIVFESVAACCSVLESK